LTVADRLKAAKLARRSDCSKSDIRLTAALARCDGNGGVESLDRQIAPWAAAGSLLHGRAERTGIRYLDEVEKWSSEVAERANIYTTTE
jgi:hypothetical protein